jgi:hypothetical protein
LKKPRMPRPIPLNQRGIAQKNSLSLYINDANLPSLKYSKSVNLFINQI